MTERDRHPFAAELQRLMRLRGLTQAELARLVPTAESVVSRWYRGLGVPTYANIERLATILNTDASSLWRLASPPAKQASDVDARQAGPFIDPAIRAEIEAQTARFERILAGVPRSMWTVYLEACSSIGEAFSKANELPLSGDAAKNDDSPVTPPKGPRNRPLAAPVPALANC